ncbi:MAG: hypothetical protein ACHQF0_13415, partial [Chitinophagales bacterium]
MLPVRKKNIYNNIACISILLFVLQLQEAAFSQNLIINGSMNSAKGVNVVAPNWHTYSASTFVANTPDINDAAGPLNCTPGYNWSGGTPVTSPDGGTWQNVFSNEDFAQTISGLTIGTTYYFRYYYASQGISAGPAADLIKPFPPSVKILGATGYSNPPAGNLFEWNTYSGTLIAAATSMTIIASQGNNVAYMAFDGFYLGTFPPANILIISQPLPDTICNGGDANFTIQTATGAGYQWQVNTGAGWNDITDNIQYTGALSSSLYVKNATTMMNNYQYRCYATGTCCDAYSLAALLTILAPSTPSIIIATTSNDICAGNPVTFTATATNAGILPIFQWTKNGINTGTDTNVYSDNNLKNGDVLNCILSSGNTCVTT